MPVRFCFAEKRGGLVATSDNAPPTLPSYRLALNGLMLTFPSAAWSSTLTLDARTLAAFNEPMRMLPLALRSFRPVSSIGFSAVSLGFAGERGGEDLAR